MLKNQENPCYWLSRLSSRMHQFQAVPNKETRSDLMAELRMFQRMVESGLAIPKTVPPTLRESKTLGEWHRRELDEALAMFKINPREDRMQGMEGHMDRYLQAFVMGRVTR